MRLAPLTNITHHSCIAWYIVILCTKTDLNEVIIVDKEIMKGSIDILLLSVICQKDSYGYEIVKDLNVKSNNLYNMSEGTLYPALKRLETKGFLECYWVDLENGGRRKYYKITDKGKKELSAKVKDWQKVDSIIRICLEGLS